MAGYNNFPGPDSKISVSVIDSRENAQDHSCSQKCFSPLDHGPDVNMDDLSLNPMMQGASGFMQTIFGGITDPGTPALTLKRLGEPGGIILGQSSTVRNGGQNGSGSGNLGSTAQVNELANYQRNISVPPDISATQDGGAQVYKILEKGQNHSLSLLDGLPLHGALFDMTGFRIPDVKGVPTAKQTNDGMVSPEALQGMMGQIMSLGQMFQGLAGNGGAGGGAGGYGVGSLATGSGVVYTPAGANTGAGGANYGGGLGNNSISAVDAAANTRMAQIINSIPLNMQAALNSVCNLIQGLEVTNGVAYLTSDVVHEQTYLDNAMMLLSQINNIDELMYCLNRLQTDTTLFGQENLSPTITEFLTAWGPVQQVIDPTGNVSIRYSNTFIQNETSFIQNLTSNTSSPALGFYTGDPVLSVNATGASLGLSNLANQVSTTLVTSNGSSSSSGIPNIGGSSGSSSSGQVIGQIQGLLGQIAGLAQGMNQNMFGESAETMKNMWKRMTRDQENDASSMHRKLNQEADVQKMSKIIEKNMQGGNPIDMQGGLYDENMLEGTGDFTGEVASQGPQLSTSLSFGP